MADGETTWEFPSSTPADGGDSAKSLVDAVAELGLENRLDPEPIGEFRTVRGGESFGAVAFLTAVADNVEGAVHNGHRLRWCFPEEARLRIRRKPLRRLLDAAVHRLAGCNLR